MPLVPTRSATAATWLSSNTILASSEVSIESDTGTVKVGDGKTRYNALNVSDVQQTSAQKSAGTSDETGTGAQVYATSPTFVTPNLGTPSVLVLTNATGTPTGLTIAESQVTNLVTDLAAKATLISPTFTPTSTSIVGVAVQGLASQTADLQQWKDSTGTVLRTVGANGILSEGTTAGAPTLASASTISPTTSIVFISGITMISTITAPSPISTYGGTIILIPTGVFLTGTSGNIALASTSVVGKTLRMTYDPVSQKWYPSY